MMRTASGTGGRMRTSRMRTGTVNPTGVVSAVGTAAGAAGVVAGSVGAARSGRVVPAGHLAPAGPLAPVDRWGTSGRWATLGCGGGTAGRRSARADREPAAVTSAPRRLRCWPSGR